MHAKLRTLSRAALAGEYWDVFQNVCRSLSRAALAGVFAALLPATAAVASATDDGRWWVVVGSSPDPDYTARDHPAVARAAAAAKRCGVEALGDFSGKWQGFAPGLYVAAAGGYATRAEAERILVRVRRCVPGAYLRHGSYAGE